MDKHRQRFDDSGAVMARTLQATVDLTSSGQPRVMWVQRQCLSLGVRESPPRPNHEGGEESQVKTVKGITQAQRTREVTGGPSWSQEVEK